VKAAFVAGYLSLALFLVGCSGGSGSVEVTLIDDETSTSAVSSDTGESTEVASERAAPAADCEPTQPDMLGPYYVPGAPIRTSVDTGYVMSGEVLSADGCEPIPGAQIEFWLADSQGVYDDAHRATMLAGEQGEYQFQSNFPGRYESRPPHIHVRVTAPGYRELVTQHYPEAGQTEGTFDLVLVAA
jgi:protocatechuate 3,4-dioxygenase beta subunit